LFGFLSLTEYFYWIAFPAFLLFCYGCGAKVAKKPATNTICWFPDSTFLRLGEKPNSTRDLAAAGRALYTLEKYLLKKYSL
jgi:hypothetical protein